MEALGIFLGIIVVGITVIVFGLIAWATIAILLRIIAPQMNYLKKVWGKKPVRDEVCNRCGSLMDGREGKRFCSKEESEECYLSRLIEAKRKAESENMSKIAR